MTCIISDVWWEQFWRNMLNVDAIKLDPDKKEKSRNLKILVPLRIAWKIIKSLKKKTFTNGHLGDEVLKNNSVRIKYKTTI
jgi:hypothetical protein